MTLDFIRHFFFVCKSKQPFYMACVTPEILFYSSSHIGFSKFYQTEVTASETCDFRKVSILGHLRVTVTNGEKIFFKDLIKTKIRWQCYYMLGLLTECSQLKYRKNRFKKHEVWRCRVSNPGPFACKANALPLSYIPNIYMFFCYFCSVYFLS